MADVSGRTPTVDLPPPDSAEVPVGPERPRVGWVFIALDIAGALPFALAPALAPTVLTIGGGSFGVLYAVAGVCAVIGAVAVLPVRRAR
jgi:hypothetical protein